MKERRKKGFPWPKGKLGKILLNLLVTAVVGFLYFYITLPALNLQATEFYGFLFLLCLVYMVCALITSGFQDTTVVTTGKDKVRHYLSFIKQQCLPIGIFMLLLVVVGVVGQLVSLPIFRAQAYRELLTVNSGEFSQDISQISFDEIPTLDRTSAEYLGDRQMGTLSDMVSQFEVMDDYTQINYQGRPVRIATLMYADVIKWMTNRSEGLPAYLLIDMVDQSVELVRLEEGIKYTTAEHFGRNLYRHLRFSYPTYMFDQPVMEINEEGVPYWICPRVVKTIGLFGGTDIQGAVLVNAITGESEYMEEVPSWVDNLYNAELIMEQYDYYGMYHNGFLNSIFGQRDVTITTEGYNYIAMGDDVYVYTGVTSTGGDQSNVGFILTNQRTKETKFYSCAGATEYSAMDSAQGELQNLRYTATFPLLLNVEGQPTYFMAMKDAAQLVKMYAMVNVQQYQIVATGETVAECERNYTELLSQNGILTGDQTLSGTETVQGAVADIRSAVQDGNSVYYIQLIGDETYYAITAAEAPLAVILSTGDQVTITYQPGEGPILTAVTLELR